MIARILPTRAPSIVILSIPRSGSSWVGSILGAASDAAYLREPITQTYMSLQGGSARSFFELNPECLPPSYQKSARSVFAGLPDFPENIVQDSSQWSLFKRSQIRVIVKEVNPFLLPWLIDLYRPRIIYLLRHPAAVASSFHKLGWMGEQFNTRFSETTLESLIPELRGLNNSFWAEFGALQALVQNLAMKYLSEYDDCLFVKYEDICLEPVEQFHRMIRFAGLNWDEELESKILERSNPADDLPGALTNLTRNSTAMIQKWKDEITRPAAEEIQGSYLRFSPKYYGSDEW